MLGKSLFGFCVRVARGFRLAVFMFEWFKQTFLWLQTIVTTTPIYIAAPAMVVIGALDSSLLSLPEVNDYLVIARCISDPKAVFYFPLFAALGSVIGCLFLYSLVRRGGRTLLHKRFRPEHIERVEAAYRHYGLLTLAIPALLPPPLPFKIFVATAGALGYPRVRFAVTIMIARSVRYYIEGLLAIYFGKRVIGWLKEDGIYVVGGTFGIVALGIILYLLWKKFQARRAKVDTVDDKA